MSECLFCDIVRTDAEATFVYRDEIVSVLMDIQPVNAGHLLVIPNAHAAYLSELEPETGAHMFRVAQAMAAAIRGSGLRCEGVNLFLADGEAAMQEIFHVHLHVIPRFEGDGFGLRFAPHYYTRPPRAELAATAGMIVRAVERARGAEGSEPQGMSSRSSP